MALVYDYVLTHSGKKVHAQHPGSSVTECGHWQGAASSHFAIEPADVEVERLCENCFPNREKAASFLRDAQKAAT